MSWFVLSLCAWAQADPELVIDAAGGLGVFSPLRQPTRVNPTLDGQLDISGFIPEAPWVGASAGTQLGLYLPRGCTGPCPAQGRWNLGVGPTVVTDYVDATLFLRLVGFGRSTDLRSALQVTGRIPVPVDSSTSIAVRPFVAVEGFRYPDLQIGVRVGTRIGVPPADPALVSGAVGGIAPAACPDWAMVGASLSPALLSATTLASMSQTEILERRLELQRELADLQAIEQSHQEMEAFRSSLTQIQDVLKDNAADTEAATAKIDEVKKAVDDFSEVVGEARDLLRTRAFDGALDASGQLSDATGQISEGVGQLGEKSTEAVEAIDKLSSMLDKLHELQEMDATRSDQLIRELGGQLGGLVEVLDPLVSAVPGLGAFLQIYTTAIERIAGSVGSITDVMLERNRIAHATGLGDVYAFNDTATQKRRCRIAELQTELGQLDLETVIPEPQRELTRQERDQLVDARIAFENGLAASGIGDEAASDYDGWNGANARLRGARNRLALAHDQAVLRERTIAHDRADLARANDAADRAQQALDGAQDAYDQATRAGADSGADISRRFDELEQARDRFREADTARRRVQDRVDAHGRALDELISARADYDGAFQDVDEAYQAMRDALPDQTHFDPVREDLADRFSPRGSFHEQRLPEIDTFLDDL